MNPSEGETPVPTTETLSSEDPKANDGANPYDLKSVEQALDGDDGSSDDDGGGEGPSGTDVREVELDETRQILEDDVSEEALIEMQNPWSEADVESARNEAKEAKSRGNELFLTEKYVEAVETYTQALRKCPVKCPKDRAVLYQNRGACKARLDQTELALKDFTRAVELDPNYFKARLKRAQTYEKSEKLDEAFQDYQHLLTMDPRHKECLEACRRLPDQIHARNEKLKTEMLSKLKDLGNLVLRPFGLSTENFQMKQDPNTGGYSISMQNSDKS